MRGPRILVALALLALLLSASSRAPERADRPERAVGASLGLFASDAEYDYSALLDELVARGAHDVMLVDVWVQPDLRANDLARAPGASPSLATVERTIRQAHERGLRVAVMPIVSIAARAPGEWRGALRPDDERAWFDAYAAMLGELAALCERTGVERLVVGSELTTLQQRDAAWRALIAEVRGVYGGTLTYSANWDAVHAVPFWDAVDEIGVSAYHGVPHAPGALPSDAQIVAAFADELAALAALGERLDRPVLITEVGFPAHADAAAYPWDETRAAPLDTALQARLLRGFCDAERATPLGGFYVWNWFGHGGPRDVGYTPRGKPAAAELETCMTRAEAGATTTERR